TGDYADADVAGSGDVDPHPVAFGEHVQGVGVPGASAGADEAVAAGVFPVAAFALAEGDIELAIPRLFRALGADQLLGFLRVDHPGAGQVALVAVAEGGEEHGVDADAVAVVQVVDDPLSAGIELAGDYHHLVGFVQ